MTTIRLALPVLLLLAACSKEPPPPSPVVERADAIAQAVATPEEATYNPALKVDIMAMRKLPSGLLIQDLTVGTGDSVAPGTTVDVRYSGWLPDGSEFDSNVNGTPFTFKLGAGQVIQGWDEGLVGMRIGGKRKLVIPPALGYGADGSGPIPANAVLVFDVELLGIRKQ